MKAKSEFQNPNAPMLSNNFFFKKTTLNMLAK